MRGEHSHYRRGAGRTPPRLGGGGRVCLPGEPNPMAGNPTTQHRSARDRRRARRGREVPAPGANPGRSTSQPLEKTTMPSKSRRHFLRQASAAALALPGGLLARHWVHAAASAAAPAYRVRILLFSRRTIAPLDKRVFGSFLEHLGRAIYG